MSDLAAITALVASITGLIVAVVGGVLAILKELRANREETRALHFTIDGQLTRMIEMAGDAGVAEGRAAGRVEEDARDVAREKREAE